MADHDAKIRRLKSAFGNLKFEMDVLESVLEVCGGNVDQAIEFLQTQNDEDVVETTRTENSLPKNYMQQPTNFELSKVHATKLNTPVSAFKALLLKETTTLAEHFKAIKQNFLLYTSVLILLLEQGVELSASTKSRCLTVIWALRHWDIAEYLLSKPEQFNLPEVLRGVKLLDSQRRIKAYEKRLRKLEERGGVKPKTLGLIRAKLNDVKQETTEEPMSVTSSLAKRIKRWVASISKEKLEFYALQMPKEPWQELADVIHFHPACFKLDWFQHHVFGKEAPENSWVKICSNLNNETVTELVQKHRIPYSYLRKNCELPPEARVVVAEYETLDIIVWWYEELIAGETDVQAKIDNIIRKRLEQGEEPNFSYGKFMERLLFFKSVNSTFYPLLIPIAQKRLEAISLPLEPPVVVLGDASYSMDVAIRTATIIASLLTALTNAELLFFNTVTVKPAVLPRNVEQVLTVATTTKADGLTAPACALWDFYRKKQVVKFFVVVTDEIENEPSQGEFFGQLFYKYFVEVFPAKIVFVSFLENPKEKGRMVRSLEALGIVPIQFRLDAKRPDLTKVDSLLGLLASETPFFDSTCQEATQNVPATNPPDFSLSKHIISVFDSSKPKRMIEEPPITTTVTEETTPIAPASTENRIVDLKKSNEEDNQCIICMTKTANTALLECGHMSYCESCAQPLKECPVCRQVVSRFLRVYRT